MNELASSRRPPSDDRELLLRIREFIADAADCSLSEVDPDVNIYEGLRVDSLGATCVFIDISYEFGIPEPKEERDWLEVNSARKIVAYVRQQEAALA